MLDTILYTLLIGLIFFLIFNLYLLWRNNLTCEYSHYWTWKIYNYKLYCIDNKIQCDIDYDIIMDYNKFMFSLFKFKKEDIITNTQVINKLLSI